MSFSFTACMKFMQEWSKKNNIYITRWENDRTTLFFYSDSGEKYAFPLSLINQYY